MTCTTRGSLARARRSTFSSSATFCVLSSVPIGSVGAYSTWAGATCGTPPTFTRRLCPAAAIERTVRAASRSAASEMSSLYANAVFSPATARTPTPWSIEKLPLLTMPSSKLQPSWRVLWKYRSASSMRCSAIVASAAAKWRSVRP